jgi:hypothetical protein
MINEVLNVLCIECGCRRFNVPKPHFKLPDDSNYWKCPICIEENNRKTPWPTDEEYDKRMKEESQISKNIREAKERRAKGENIWIKKN